MSPCNRAHKLKYTKLLYIYIYPSELVAYSILSNPLKHTYLYLYIYMLHTDDSLFCIEYWIIHLQHITKSVFLNLYTVCTSTIHVYVQLSVSKLQYVYMTAGFFLPHFVSPDSENLKAQFEQKQLPRYCWGAHERNLAKIHGIVIGENDCDGNFGYNIKTTMKIPVIWLTSIPILWGEVTQVTIRIAFIYLSGSPRRTVFCCLHITFLLRVFEDSQK